MQRLLGDKERRFARVQEHNLEEREAGSAENFEQTETQSRTADLGQVTVSSIDDRGEKNFRRKAARPDRAKLWNSAWKIEVTRVW